jgi:hypothetical protein
VHQMVSYDNWQSTRLLIWVSRIVAE